jgi:hypothetical protein
MTPSCGFGNKRAFYLNYFDEHGYADLTTVSMTAQDDNENCIITYSPPTNALQIQSDGGSTQTGILGDPGISQTNRCALNTGISTASSSGNILTFSPAITFKPIWEGDKTITLSATDYRGRSYRGIRGKWTAGPSSNTFNSDGNPDILWHNASTGEIVAWLMNGTKPASSVSIGRVADPNWIIAGSADFNGDGKSDILWRNTSTGENYVWFMDGVQCTGGAYLDSELENHALKQCPILRVLESSHL